MSKLAAYGFSRPLISSVAACWWLLRAGWLFLLGGALAHRHCQQNLSVRGSVCFMAFARLCHLRSFCLAGKEEFCLSVRDCESISLFLASISSANFVKLDCSCGIRFVVPLMISVVTRPSQCSAQPILRSRNHIMLQQLLQTAADGTRKSQIVEQPDLPVSSRN